MLSPTSGRITADGISITAMGEDYRCHLGYLPQSFGYYPDFTAREFMAYIAALKGIRKPFARKQTANLLEMVSLTDVADKKIRTFSGGMKRRLGIAQAVLGNPDLLILDEPTVGLDPKERVRFRNLIADLARDKIVILSTHIVSDVEYIADHILLMKSGRLLLSQQADEIIHAMDGKVWTCHLLREQADRLNTCCTVVNLHHNGTKYVTVRIVADKKPFDNAILMEPTLEDLYLYYFQNKDREENNQ